MIGDGSWAAAGAWTGAHALALLAGLLALGLAVTLGLWGFAHRPARPAGGSPPASAAPAVMVGGAALFLALASQLGPGSGMTAFDLALSDAIREHTGSAVVGGFALLTHAGDAATRVGLALAVGVALLAARQRLLALGLVAALAGNGALTTLLKAGFGRVRPLQPAGGESLHGFSFPSGHSAGSVVAYGLLAYLVWRLLPPRWHLPACVAAVTLGLTVGASRVFVGAHFASDVLAGFAAGAAWLALCVWALERARGPR